MTEESNKNSNLMSEKYRLMMYFAHTTLCIYSKTIVSDENMTTLEFMKKNSKVTQRVFDEGLSIFNYELSSNQIATACAIYLKNKYKPDSVEETEASQIPQN